MSEETKLRAYSVTTDWSEVSVVVFARSVGKAKSLARQTDWLCDEVYSDLRAHRESEADRHADTYGENALDASTPDQCAVLRDLGWYEITNGSEACRICQKYPWTLIEASRLNENYICGECSAPDSAKEEG